MYLIYNSELSSMPSARVCISDTTGTIATISYGPIIRCNVSCNLEHNCTLKRCKFVTNVWYVKNTVNRQLYKKSYRLLLRILRCQNLGEHYHLSLCVIIWSRQSRAPQWAELRRQGNASWVLKICAKKGFSNANHLAKLCTISYRWTSASSVSRDAGNDEIMVLNFKTSNTGKIVCLLCVFSNGCMVKICFI